MVYVLGLTAAVLLAIGFVLQQHAAEEEPVALRFSPYLLVDLLRRPLWVTGIVAMIGGLIASAAAFAQGAVALVEPLLASTLLFALPLTALYHRRRMQLLDGIGAVVLVAGLALFVAAGRPDGGSPESADMIGWAAAFGSILAVVLVIVLLFKRFGSLTEAALLATAAGMLFGLQDTLTQAADHLLTHGIGALLTSWIPYTVIGLGVVGLTFTQMAFAAAPLSASLPAQTAVEPVVGIALGIMLFDERVNTSLPAIVGQAVGIIAIVAGVIVIGRSPLVTGEFHRIAERHHKRVG
ncbi:DMT family transporter [Speluncibacter jeojiensis]|uniref:DMT family transporter n=1 Tax=Speluncibacter jeojiensis TaxID=2710754 RepID=A0A9X4LZL9_9ACTN|nr:DMT family transporter [Corynebacteriales bacterium D3-21]